MSGYSMQREIEAACKWWAEQLKQPPTHTVDGSFRELVANRASAYCPPVTPEQIERFAQALRARLTDLVKKYEINPEIPRWGAALRCFGVTYGPDPELSAALSEAEIECPSLRFSFNTRMWLDPGCVTVRGGASYQEEIVWQGSIQEEL